MSGAMFGDNLSFISDTTIVATRTQGCEMADKFKVNIRIALPMAAHCRILIFPRRKRSGQRLSSEHRVEWVKVIPYLVVLVTAICD